MKLLSSLSRRLRHHSFLFSSQHRQTPNVKSSYYCYISLLLSSYKFFLTKGWFVQALVAVHPLTFFCVHRSSFLLRCSIAFGSRVTRGADFLIPPPPSPLPCSLLPFLSFVDEEEALRLEAPLLYHCRGDVFLRRQPPTRTHAQQPKRHQGGATTGESGGPCRRGQRAVGINEIKYCLQAHYCKKKHTQKTQKKSALVLLRHAPTHPFHTYLHHRATCRQDPDPYT